MKEWHNLGFFGKRFHGFACYILCAFISLFISPEAADRAMYETLARQFKEAGE